MVNLDRCILSWNTFDGISSKKYVLNKTEHINLNIFNMITRLNESKKYCANVSVNWMVENVIQIKRGITINVDVSKKIRENIKCAKKNRFGILVHILVKMVSITSDLVNAWHQSKNKLKRSNKLKEIDMKNRTYCFFNDLIKVKSRQMKSHTKTFSFTTLDTWRSLHWIRETQRP